MLTNYKSKFFTMKLNVRILHLQNSMDQFFYFVFDCGNPNAVFKGAFIALFFILNTHCVFYHKMLPAELGGNKSFLYIHSYIKFQLQM